MSDSLATRFAGWRDAGHKALVPYLTAGYPTPGQTLELMRGLAGAGADVIEVGVPFSDPVADGPTIQRSSQVAIEQGVHLEWVLEQIREFRKDDDTAVVIFTYLNPVLSYGWRKFIEEAVSAGAQGVLLTDLPLGGDAALESAFAASSLALIRLIAPTTTPERARAIAANAEGFLYYIARMGVTGARAALPDDLDEQINSLRAVTSTPICVGFGISTPDQAAAVSRTADGIVIGSALIDAIDRGGIAAAARLLANMRAAIDSAKSA